MKIDKFKFFIAALLFSTFSYAQFTPEMLCDDGRGPWLAPALGGGAGYQTAELARQAGERYAQRIAASDGPKCKVVAVRDFSQPKKPESKNNSASIPSKIASSTQAGSGKATPKNITVELNEENCKKIDGYGKDDRMSIANTFGVSVASVSFLNSRWESYSNGVRRCFLIFDTAVGPKKCIAPEILSDDGGKSTFSVIDKYGYGKVSTSLCF